MEMGCRDGDHGDGDHRLPGWGQQDAEVGVRVPKGGTETPVQGFGGGHPPTYRGGVHDDLGVVTLVRDHVLLETGDGGHCGGRREGRLPGLEQEPGGHGGVGEVGHLAPHTPRLCSPQSHFSQDPTMGQCPPSPHHPAMGQCPPPVHPKTPGWGNAPPNPAMGPPRSHSPPPGLALLGGRILLVLNTGLVPGSRGGRTPPRPLLTLAFTFGVPGPS